MNKIIIGCLSLFTMAGLQAQQKEGKVIYQRTLEMRMVLNDGGGAENVAHTRTDKFELNFANNQMSIKQMEEEMQDDNFSGGGGMVVRTFGASPDDVTFCDFEKGLKVEQREFFDKKFLITDSIRRNNWKLTEETKTILNHVCRKASSQRLGKRMVMNMDNGKMERKEVDDTSTIVAWFTTDIPVSAGPEVQGQLPGLVLQLEINGGRTVYTALEISANPNLAAIKEPTKGKKLTTEEFTNERNKMMDELQRNGRGGRTIIRTN